MIENKLRVFVPSYGAGLASYIENNEICHEGNIYVYIELILNKINLYIPENKISKYKIRGIMRREAIEEAFEIIAEQPIFIEKKWGKRYRLNNEKIDSGDIFKICEVLRDLYYLHSKGLIPPGERSILSRAEEMLASEITLSFNISLLEAIEIIRSYS